MYKLILVTILRTVTADNSEQWNRK